MKQLSILTPTYNRAKLLINLYNSIAAQDCNDIIEWIVISDGSNDNTREVMENLKTKSEFEIKFFEKENGGKASAHNMGIQYADSEITIICDDDDYFCDGALKKVLLEWRINKYHKIGGMIGYRGSYDLTRIGNRSFPSKKICNLEDIFPRNKFFDTVQIYKTNILKEITFPITYGEKFVPEIWLWREIDKQYKLLIIDEIIEICEYRKDGLTKTRSQKIWNNPVGYSFYFKQSMEMNTGINKIKYYGIYKCLYKSTGVDKKMKFKAMNIYDILSLPIQIVVKILLQFHGI